MTVVCKQCGIEHESLAELQAKEKAILERKQEPMPEPEPMPEEPRRGKRRGGLTLE